MLEIEDEHLAIADRARTRGPRDGFQHLLDERVRYSRFDLRLRDEVDRVLGAAIELGVPLLSAEALDLGHRHALHARLGQRLADVLELERLDDRRYQFHRQYLVVLFIADSLAPDGEVLLDAEDERGVATRFAVVRVADDEVGAVGDGDREVYAVIFEGVGVAELEVIRAAAAEGILRRNEPVLNVSAPQADFVVRSLLRRNRDGREVVVRRVAETIPLADRDVEREDAVADAEIDL